MIELAKLKNLLYEKTLRLVLIYFLLFSGCYMSKTVSDFVKTDIELEITKDDLIKKFGEHYSINKRGEQRRRLSGGAVI